MGVGWALPTVFVSDPRCLPSPKRQISRLKVVVVKAQFVHEPPVDVLCYFEIITKVVANSIPPIGFGVFREVLWEVQLCCREIEQVRHPHDRHFDDAELSIETNHSWDGKPHVARHVMFAKPVIGSEFFRELLFVRVNLDRGARLRRRVDNAVHSPAEWFQIERRTDIFPGDLQRVGMQEEAHG